jgi:signal transduction histidine kinase
MKLLTFLRRLRLKRKLMLVIMATSAMGLLLAAAFFALYERHLARAALVRDLITLSQLIGDRSTAALLFDDPRSAEESLAALRFRDNVVAAGIYRQDGTLFASYTAPNVAREFPAAAPTRVYYFERNGLVLFEPIVLEGKRVGVVHIRASLEGIGSRQREYLTATFLILIGAGLASYFLSSRLQRVISEPLAQVTDTAHRIAHERDFAVRARETGDAEADVLVRAFNEMLATIEEKNKELHETNKSLEQRVAARTEELHAAMVRAEAADRLKSAFLATMSHELRTPLNSIIGFTGILLQGLAGPLSPEQHKQLSMVRGSARHLLELINDVLDISKIEAGQLEVRPTPFSLTEAIEHVAATVKPMAEKKGLTLRTTITPGLEAIVADRRRFEQILLNLLNNAIKFTERGEVNLVASSIADYRRSPESEPVAAVRLAIADTGIGIKDSDLPKLFQPFRQIDTGLTRTHEGTGLGLAICRRLAALMGGEIAASSVWLRGSVFTVTLPLQPTFAP